MTYQKQSPDLKKAKEALQEILQTLRPPPRLSISEWADTKRKLSPESCAEYGQWYTERAEYQRGIMDAISDPKVEIIIIMAAARIGKTECINNAIGYYIDQDPSSILVVHPTETMAKAWSRDYLAPMIRDTPCLTEKVPLIFVLYNTPTIIEESSIY